MRFVVFVVDERAVVVVGIGEAAEGVVAGGVVRRTAGKRSGGVLLARALGAAIDVKPDHGIACVDQLLRDVEFIERVVVRRIAKLPHDRFDLVVGGVVRCDQGDGAVGGVEDFEWWWWRRGARWVDLHVRYLRVFWELRECWRLGVRSGPATAKYA